MSTDAVEGRRPERDEDQVAGVGGDARETTDEHDDEGQRRRRSGLDELADQRRHHPRLLGDADADHRHEDDGDDAEAGEVVDERGEEEANAVGAEQALDLRGLLDDVHLVVEVLLRRDLRLGNDRATDILLLGDQRRLDGDVVGDADVKGGEDRREHDDQHAQADEDDRRVGHLVADLLDAVEHSLHAAALGRLLLERHRASASMWSALSDIRLPLLGRR